MIVNKEKIKQKLLISNKECEICKNYFIKEEIINLDFEFCKTKNYKFYFHKHCI